MALYAFDGTCSSDHEDLLEDTNVVWFRDAYDGEVLYLPGPGTRFGVLGRIVGGIAGFGGHLRVRKALAEVQRNLQRGDSVIDVVGFSRGAALALHFVNSLPPGLKVRFLGLWDTVPSFGLPGNTIDFGWKLGLPLAAECVCHAMAMHETRYNFVLHRLEANSRVTEMWFPGVHSDVGGGNRNSGLSSIPLDWVYRAAHRAGVPLKTHKVAENRARMNPAAPVSRILISSKLRPRRIAVGDCIFSK